MKLQTKKAKEEKQIYCKTYKNVPKWMLQG